MLRSRSTMVATAVLTKAQMDGLDCCVVLAGCENGFILGKESLPKPITTR